MTDNNLAARRINGVHVLTSMPPREDRSRTLRHRVLAASRELLEVPETAPRERTKTVACVIPAYNEEDSIASVLDAVLAQTRPPEVVHVVVNNTDDMTMDVVRPYVTNSRGPHIRTISEGSGIRRYATEVAVHNIGKNADKKVGALNYGWAMAAGHDYLLGVDGDTILDRHCVEHLYAEIQDDPRIGGISAIYGIDPEDATGILGKSLLSPGQRANFAAFNMDNLLRGRNMAVLGGQCSLFNMRALDAVQTRYHQQSPWVRDSEVEDSLLSLQIKKLGFSTKISATARANVGAMGTLKALHAQQVKWTYGSIDLMWPGVRGDTQGQPFHPNLRLRWRENISMVANIVTRLGFISLLAAALSIGAFVFNPIWLVPPIAATLLNTRIAFSMRNTTGWDIAYAALLFPVEIYMWIRMGHFVSAWMQFLTRVEKDNWAAQASAEKGRGSSAWAYPFIGVVVIAGVAIWQWSVWSVETQSLFLAFGWPLLYFLAIIQTLFIIKKVLRRHRGFQV